MDKNGVRGKVGIITIHDSQNCGALLQAYALQEAVKSINFDCELIDHNRFASVGIPLEKRNTNRKKDVESVKSILSKAKGYWILRKDSPQKREACQCFRDNFLNISRRKYTEIVEIEAEPPMYDAYICGSDQIWNPERIKASAPFFLSFVPEHKLKISYAPSLGVSAILEPLQSEYRRYLNRLNFISVREKQGAELVSKILGKKVESVLDPTFLIEKEAWISLASKEKYCSSNYIFCYFLNFNSALCIREDLNAYARKNNLKVVVFQAKCAGVDRDWIPAYGLGPCEFLSAIHNASLVITDSFHGTALSINLEKDFYVYNAESKLPFESRFERLNNILNLAGLSNRVLNIGDRIHSDNIDFQMVGKRLDQEICRSKEYLADSLSSLDVSVGSSPFFLPYKETSCIGCGVCAVRCNSGALVIKMDQDGFYRPEYDATKCIQCNACIKSCPVIHDSTTNEKVIAAYSAWNKSNELVRSSSSGGVFSALANAVLADNGVVYGASYDPATKTVMHIQVSKKEDLAKCRGSKYIQSDMSKTLLSVKAGLKEGKKVLFTGTPCQCAAVRAVVADAENVILCDVVCHGVGSAGLFKDYLESIEAKNGKKTTDFVFRDESLGWNRPSVRFEFEDGTTVKERWYKNRFIQAFSKNKILRSSCYECKYSSIPRISDVSIADFWGAKKIKAAFNKHGTSLVLVHSAKGEEILSAASAELVMREVNYQDAIKYNKSAVSSVKKPEMRDTLFYHLRTDGYKYVEKRYLYLLSVPQKIVRKLKNFL